MNVRIPIAILSLSAAGFAGLLLDEGYTDKAVIPVKGDVPTYGFGSTTRIDGKPVRMGDTITPVKAVQRSFAYLQAAEKRFKSCVKVELSQQEYDLYMNFSYQYGMPTFCQSSIVRNLNARKYRQACDSLLLYRKVNGADCSDQKNWYGKGADCRGVWDRQVERHSKCMEAQQ